MNRRQLLQRLAALAVATRLTELRAELANSPTPVAPGLHEFSGEVTVNGQPARQGMPIKPGDRIVTGSNSKAIYVIGGDAYLQRDRSTVQTVADEARSGLRVVTGKLLAVFAKGDKTIETPTATIGIRGTGCYIETESKRDYFCLCYGKAEIASNKQPGKIETVETRHHDHPLYLTANGKHMMVPAKVKNHSDAELILLESLVGRRPPFYGMDYAEY